MPTVLYAKFELHSGEKVFLDVRTPRSFVRTESYSQYDDLNAPPTSTYCLYRIDTKKSSELKGPPYRFYCGIPNMCVIIHTSFGIFGQNVPKIYVRSDNLAEFLGLEGPKKHMPPEILADWLEDRYSTEEEVKIIENLRKLIEQMRRGLNY